MAESCAAFASLTLELAAQVVGQQSWVSGGSSYPWPLHSWADVRVEPNPASLGIISIQQDAEAQHRWHPLGDGYRPLPGDWVLFDGHVEVITEDSRGVLRTVGGDSLPNFSVNAHEYRAPLSGAGVVGFVNNGLLPAASGGPGRSVFSEPGRVAFWGATAGRLPGGQGARRPEVRGPRRARPAGAWEDSPPSPGPRRREAGPAEERGPRRTHDPGGGQQRGREPAEAGSREAGRPKSAHRTPGDAAIPGLAGPAPRSGAATEKGSGHEAAADGGREGRAVSREAHVRLAGSAGGSG